MGKQRPGVMLYFDLRPSLKRLSIEDKGILFEAILDYAELGVLPELDGIVAVAWDFIQPRIDKDQDRYDEISRKRTDAINKRWEREKTIQMNTNDTNDTNEYNPIQAIPTTTSNSISNSTSSSTIVSDGGTEGEEVVFRPKEILADKPMDWERKKRHALDAFNNHFGKATKDAVVEYALSHGRTEQDANSFYEYYSERGWTCHGKPIDDWRGLFSAWKKRGSDTAQDPPAESELERLLKKHGARRWDGNNRGRGVVDNGGSLCFAMGGKLHIFPEEWLFVTDEKDWFLDQSIFYLEQELRNGRAYSEIVRDFC